MTQAVASPTLPHLLENVEVARTERVSPSFVRLELAGPGLAALGPDGPPLDQRFKLVLPAAGRPLPDLRAAGTDWWSAWQALPPEDRGSIRTYTIGRRLGSGEATRLELDVVVHEAHSPEDDGPGNRWARTAAPGDRALVVAPRIGHPFGGIEWAPGAARRLLIAGDETAWPAIRGILRALPVDAVGDAVVELPRTDDVMPSVTAPAGVRVHWLPRDGARRGSELQQRVLDLLGTPHAVPGPVVAAVDEDLWETPTYSSSGEDVDAAPSGADELYAWIAGESRVVTGLRRALVGEAGLHRRQVAFMGYWREGVAMRG